MKGNKDIFYSDIYIYFLSIYKMKLQKKKIRRILYIIIVVLLVLVIFLFVKCAVSKNEPTICADKTCRKLEIADTPEKREVWLMNRTSLDEDRGMLFIFDQPGIHAFWMKNTPIPLDMIWLDKNYKIVYIKYFAQPCQADPCQTYNPWVSASYVLELKGGTTEKINLKVWDTLVLKN